MTNLEVIKYLATNNPTRLASFLNRICYDAWDFGRLHWTRPITDWDEWLQADPHATWDFNPNEIEEWSKVINPTPTLEAFYGSKSKVIDQAIDEIELLENVLKNYPDSVCISFREKFCISCLDTDYCPKSKMAIVECPKFDDYYENYEEK